MATDIQLKRSSTPGSVPDAANVLVGEPVFNLADRILYTKDTTGNIITISSGSAGDIAALAYQAANVAAAYTVAGIAGNVSNAQLASGITSSGLLTTANISELTNLYFTNARARASISLASGNVYGKGSYDSSTGILSISAANVTVSTTAPSNPNVGDIWINASTATVYLFFGDGDSYQWVETGASVAATGSTYGDSNVALLGYATNANVALKANISDLTTANVAEVTNLYYTNARVYSNVIQLNYITNSALSGYATNAQLTSYATTTNVALKANIVDLTTTNVTEVSNLYFTNARSYANVITLGYAKTANLTTANVTEVTNLYFTNARATAAVTSASLSNITVNGQANVVYTPASTVGVAYNITAANTKGGAGYADFLQVTNASGGATASTKYLRLNSTGELQIINSVYTSQLLVLNDAGDLTVLGNVTSSGNKSGYSSGRPGFRVYGSGTVSGLAINQNTYGALNSNNFAADYNQGSYLNTSTGVFTAPVAGLYQIYIVGRNAGNASYSQLAVIKNATNGTGNSTGVSGGSVACMIEWAGSSTMNHTGAGTILKLAVGDTLALKVLAGTIDFDGNDNWAVAYIG